MSTRKYNDVKEILSPRSYVIMQIRKQHLKSNSKDAKKLLPYTFMHQVIMIVHSSKPNTNDDG